MARIKKNDMVLIISGKDKGKSGRVLHVYPKVERALVENLNLVKKAKRKTQQDQQGGIVDIEAPIHLSNLMPTDQQASPVSKAKAAVKEIGKTKNTAKAAV